jgi:two-component system, LytTR family, sensor kinase
MEANFERLTPGSLDILTFLTLGFSGIFISLMCYGQNWYLALADSALMVLALAGGIYLLDHVLKYYPSAKVKAWPALMFSLIMAIAMLFTVKELLDKIFTEEEAYRLFVEKSLPPRLFVLLVCFYIVSIFILHGRTTANDFRMFQKGEQQKKLTKEAELNYLRQQLQPHFLFNSLNSINALVTVDPEKAREMVQGLADFFRENLKKEPMKWDLLENEVKVITQYLAMEKIRFGHRLDFEVDIHEEAAALSLPPLMIQPLVENAVKHGLYGITGEILIRIGAKKEKNNLIIEVQNPTENSQEQAKGTGFGLESLNRRLYLLFGRKDLLSWKKEDNLFVATLKIPQPQ